MQSAVVRHCTQPPETQNCPLRQLAADVHCGTQVFCTQAMLAPQSGVVLHWTQRPLAPQCEVPGHRCVASQATHAPLATSQTLSPHCEELMQSRHWPNWQILPEPQSWLDLQKRQASPMPLPTESFWSGL